MTVLPVFVADMIGIAVRERSVDPNPYNLCDKELFLRANESMQNQSDGVPFAVGRSVMSPLSIGSSDIPSKGRCS